MASPLQPEILIAHPWMGRGGSEATAMWTLHALQHRARVTFTTASPVDWDDLNAVYGTSVDPAKIKLLPAPRLPGVNSGTKVAYWQRAWFERFCRTQGREFDACISAYNPIHFDHRAIQLIGDFSFDEKCRLALYPTAQGQAHHRPSLVRKIYLTIGEYLARRHYEPVLTPADMIVANSKWTAARLREHFPLEHVPVLYPPSLLAKPQEGTREPLGFVAMNRITPEKEIDTLITILDRVRAAGRPVTLDLVGRIGEDAYSRRIQAMVDERREWVRTPGFLDAREKLALFSSRSFAIHTSRVEAFGIAVAEMAAAGLIPFVPAGGGTREIAGHEQLIYADPDDAAAKILAVMDQPDSHSLLRRSLRDNVERFAPEPFSVRLVEIVQDFLGRPI
ncbi:glycosyltransferase family 4 protein [Luteolibacter flavescens]|uniref:Glycosyltransferase family 4 protein n=1 Tax=Luteolibacter flavescens TaxID=1859460 RepID=A0ABT3FNV3_9BACT|nr:glycosyltransferase family 4 protein [Luteolibacter flavescens]MCW1885255.1 glycosyltransferase family 4 protein [Luteolibacter flavescens]